MIIEVSINNYRNTIGENDQKLSSDFKTNKLFTNILRKITTNCLKNLMNNLIDYLTRESLNFNTKLVKLNGFIDILRKLPTENPV